ncbi:purine-cytosine permease family protein [Actinomadura verrucosospora]|uniref:Cytosine/purines uracil thiamine allantoin permease n=1 Tax=Actinomadura verrucosospora TaxID=46165 RepID=A0A7D3ZSJ2_ACTVE|nr:cytosine permease [Actinomadura verrucosospora]QKG26603.1 cytosine/purines uracil thiamine allantoin permease [Actinomadura verrucosospora]
MSSSPSPGSGASAAAHSLDPVPPHARESTAGNQFWIWSGANIAPINWVLGALGIKLGLSLADTVGVLVAGNLVGMAVFGLFVLMGQRTGVTQMVLARSAFGRRGAYLPAALQGVMSAGWCAVNTWIVLDLVMALLGQVGVHGGNAMKIVVVLVIMGLQVWIAASGFHAIAAFEKWTVPVTLAVLAVMTVVAWTKTGVHWDHQGQGLTGKDRLSAMTTVMTAIGVGWGITWFAYASDYSRFVPRSVPRRRLYASSVLGQFVPVVWLGVLGASLATVSATTDPGKLIVDAFGALAIPVLLLVVHGPIATNILNVYSCSLCAQTVDWHVSRKAISYGVGLFAAAFTILLIFQQDFANTLDAWLGGLVTWVVPWAAVMGVHFYVVRRQNVDVDALYDPPGRSRLGDFRWDALVSFVLGAAATWAFQYGVPKALQGPAARALGGIDLSWLAGALVAGALYFVLSARRGGRAWVGEPA